ncbi:MAG TPA: NAD(P)/FAD-dependent oxidoreductase [Rhodanobacteraceae bacterium]|nr:NAD(P)/FAD-dependent oxidoreductase [Rhodanobacteraceae bacterium]
MSEMMAADKPKTTVIGAGLVGSLLATLLAQRGFEVEVFERRPDPRVHGFLGGRSINLALAERGLNALRQAGLADSVLQHAVMMRGRMVHPLDGEVNLQRYGLDDSEVIRSVSRGGLNILLLDAAEQAGARLHFDAGLSGADFGNGSITLTAADGATHTHAAGLLLGCDGAGSALRMAMQHSINLGERIESLGHGYKELEIPSPGQARFALEPNALHIWPRGNYMCIALPNTEANFTVTLFLPSAGSHPSFATLPDVAAARAFFEDQFADALALMPTFDEDWAAHPVGQLATLYLDRWHLGGSAVLLGDAAHAVVPFHGQGMNAGFEDAVELAGLLTAQPDDAAAVFAEFESRRKPNADAIAAMSLANYIEMRDGVADPRYLLKRELAAALTARIPTHFRSHYRMVSFTTWPYAYCNARDQQQDALMGALLDGHATLDEIDLAAAAERVRSALPPLPPEP